MIIFDVGANTGLSTKNFINSNNFIYSFEPIPYLCEYYLFPLRSSNYFVIQKAVSDFNGRATFNIAKQDYSLTDGSLYGCSSLHQFSEDLNSKWPGRKDFEFFEEIEVDTIRMDKFIKENNIGKVDYLKCDTQGNDLKVLKSFGNYIKVLYSGTIECVNKNSLYKDVDNSLDSATYFLESVGFNITDIQSNDKFNNEVNVSFSRI